MKTISRRMFTQGMASLLATGPFLSTRLSRADEEVPAPIVQDAPIISVAEGRNPVSLVQAALDALGGIERWVKPGQRVVVKPNIGWDRLPQMAANTNPQIVGEVCRLCKEAGAAQVLVFDRTCNDARRCYTSSGIAEAAQAAGAQTPYIRESDLQTAFRTIQIPDGTRLREWTIYGDALDADVYINIPIAKHHTLTQLTLGIKNTMGILGGERGQLHVDLGEKLADIHRIFKPTLTIMDAYRVLVRNGPTGGNPRDTELKFTVIAGEDVVAVDAFTTTLFDLKPDDISFIRASAAAGIGVADLDRIQIKRVEV